MKRGLSQRFWKRWNRSLQSAGIGHSGKGMRKTYPSAFKSTRIGHSNKGMRMTCPSAFKRAGTGLSIPLWKEACPSAFGSAGIEACPSAFGSIGIEACPSAFESAGIGSTYSSASKSARIGLSKSIRIGPSYHLKIFRLPTYFFQLPTTLASHFWSPTSLLQMFSSHPHFLSLSLFLSPFPLLLSSSLLKTHHFFSKISNTKLLPKTTNPTQRKVSLSSSHFYFVAIFVYIYIYIYICC